jgi:hypothetical protein
MRLQMMTLSPFPWRESMNYTTLITSLHTFSHYSVGTKNGIKQNEWWKSAQKYMTIVHLLPPQ